MLAGHFLGEEYIEALARFPVFDDKLRETVPSHDANFAADAAGRE